LNFSPGAQKSLRRFVEKNEINRFERTLASQICRRFAQHDFRAVFQRKSRDARANG